jgi:hypothetical protein
MPAVTHEHLIAALEQRFDYASARIVAADVLAAAGVPPAAHYNAATAAQIAAAIAAQVSRSAGVLQAMGASAHAAPATAAATPAPAAAAEQEPPHASTPAETGINDEAENPAAPADPAAEAAKKPTKKG